MTTHTLYINIGTNSGDRRAMIAQAVAAIVSCPLFAGATVRRSATVESEPWGFLSENRFLNVGLAVECVIDTSPAALHTLLDALQAIERSISPLPHRNSDGTYRDRGIDIDIIALDTLIYSDERLSIPHPRASLRDFVMTPLRELSPAVAEWIEHEQPGNYSKK